jgi:dTDP-4-dehydrorhamnose 3,5-epimerase
MNVIRGELDGLVILEPKVFGDARGAFFESWNQRRYADAGIQVSFVQDNFSVSRKGAIRGLHFQNPSPQGKLVSVLQGEVFDVAVDLRRSSPTFGRWQGVALSQENRRQFFIPAGFAHGFAVASDTALFHYKCTDYYSPKDETTLRWDDPQVGIKWPFTNPILSEKDAQGVPLKDLPTHRLFA